MKKTITILVVLSLLLSSIPFLMKTANAAQIMTLSDAELAGYFNKKWGPGINTSRVDVSGNGVQFNFTGLTSSGTAMGDGYPVNQAAGGALYDGHYSDFSANTQYSIVFVNTGTTNVSVNLWMNTGFTTGWPLNDTYWETPSWTDVKAGETKTVTLSFTDAKCYNANDDPETAWRHPDGTTGVTIRRLNQVTKIGFQVAGSGAGSLLARSLGLARLYADPNLVEKHIGDVDSFFDVTIKLEDFNDLYGFDIEVTWDDTLLKCSLTSQNAFLNALWAGWSIVAHTNGTGYYNLAAVCTVGGGGGGRSSVASMGLMKLTFQVRNPQTNSMRQTLIHLERHDLSDSNANVILHTAEDGTYKGWGQAPTLALSKTSRTCRTYGEAFNVTIIMSDAASVTDFTIEIDYATTLLNVSTVTWDTWSAGTATDNKGAGKITLSNNGAAISGSNKRLVTIVFKGEYRRVWKSIAGYVNDQSGQILLQSATLSFPSPQPNLNYTRGGTDNTINADAATMTYTFSPIKGDIKDNNGKVELLDLTRLTFAYKTTNAELNLINQGNTDYIDIYDVVILASNYWFEYTYPGL